MCKHSWITTLSYRSDWWHFYNTRFSVCIKCHKVMEIPLSDLKIDYSKAPGDGTWWKGLRYNDKKVISNDEARNLRGLDKND